MRFGGLLSKKTITRVGHQHGTLAAFELSDQRN
jgi:hypothetical protein